MSEGKPSLFFVQNYQLTFGGPGASVSGPNFHYTMAPAICQEEMLHKKQTIKIPQYVHSAYCNPLLDVL